MKYICDVTNTPINNNENVTIELDARDHENNLDFRDDYKTLRQRLMVSGNVAKYLIYIIKTGKLKQLYEIEKDDFLPTLEQLNQLENRKGTDA